MEGRVDMVNAGHRQVRVDLSEHAPNKIRSCLACLHLMAACATDKGGLHDFSSPLSIPLARLPSLSLTPHRPRLAYAPRDLSVMSGLPSWDRTIAGSDCSTARVGSWTTSSE